MASDPEREKLDEMAARIRQAEVRPKEANTTPLGDARTVKASRIGFDFAATVLVCIGVGWLADREFGSGPWVLLAMMLIGFAAGIANVWRAMQKSEDRDQGSER